MDAQEAYRQAQSKAGKDEASEIECLPCTRWIDLQRAWKGALKWTDGLDRALSVMLSSIISTPSINEQLWVRVISPPSSGKTVLCEALSVNRRWVFPKDTMTGMFSGYQMDEEASEDFSLVSKIKGKTLVIKDGDTILQAPNRPQILSQLRAIYDRSVRTSYGNRASRDYEGLNATVILCGTASLHQLDTSELGERFLTVVIMDGIDDDLEDEILWRVANRTDRGMCHESNGTLEGQHDPDMVQAMRLTGGYVGHLRDHGKAILSAVEAPESALRFCMRLGKFVAFTRARPSVKQDEQAEREFGARLVSQMVKLAKCLAAVLNRPTVDEEVMRRVRSVAFDSGRGKTFNIIRVLHGVGEVGLPIGSLSVNVGEGEDKLGSLMRFLKKIGAVDTFQAKAVKGLGGQRRWKLTDKMHKLYEEVTDNDA